MKELTEGNFYILEELDKNGKLKSGTLMKNKSEENALEIMGEVSTIGKKTHVKGRDLNTFYPFYIIIF